MPWQCATHVTSPDNSSAIQHRSLTYCAVSARELNVTIGVVSTRSDGWSFNKQYLRCIKHVLCWFQDVCGQMHSSHSASRSVQTFSSCSPLRFTLDFPATGQPWLLTYCRIWTSFCSATMAMLSQPTAPSSQGPVQLLPSQNSHDFVCAGGC